MGISFKALYVTEQGEKFNTEIKKLDTGQLTEQELLVKVKYSSLNYKDALSASGNRGVTRKYPHVPGIDAAGVVAESKSPGFNVGDEVIVTGFDLGMNTWGGFGEYISIPAAWAVPLPENLTLREAMSFGTAGLTAGLSVHRLIQAGAKPADGPIAVSGATGGVGSISIGILAKLGFEVLAISGKNEKEFLLQTLGASDLIDRAAFINTYNSKPLAATVFAGAIDTVGGDILSGMLKATKYGGTVTACGMVAAGDLYTSVFPFILRSVTLAGIDSVAAPMSIRKEVWQKLAGEWKPDHLHELTHEIKLEDLPEKIDAMLKGEIKGRFVVDI